MRGYTPTSDADSYLKIGRAVSVGQGYAFTLPFEFVHATAIRPPLYPTLIAGAFKVFGYHVGVAQGVNVVAGCVAAVLAGVVGSRISGPRGLGAGLVFACYPPLVANDVTVLVESTAVVLLFVTMLLVLDGRTALAGIARSACSCSTGPAPSGSRSLSRRGSCGGWDGGTGCAWRRWR